MAARASRRRRPISGSEFSRGEQAARISGRIDRVDTGVVAGHSVFNVLDYKTGGPITLTPESITAGLTLQPPLYALAVMELLMVDRNLYPWQAGYWYIREGGFRPRQALRMYRNDEGRIELEPAWEALRATLGDTVVMLVHAIRRGRFPVSSRRRTLHRPLPLEHHLPHQSGPFSGEDMSADSRRVKPSGWTDEQRRAITARGHSVALSAGAGCGKTFVLTERFLAELEPGGTAAPPHLSQLVAITFTERAAREMRDRIRKACRERLRGCPDEQAALLAGAPARAGFGADQHDPRFLRRAFTGPCRRGRHRPALRRARRRPGRNPALRAQRRGAT